MSCVCLLRSALSSRVTSRLYSVVPEALFHPSDIGLTQAGLSEVVTQAVNAVPKDLRGMLLGNVVLAGGCAALPGFRERLEADLRPLVPSEEALVVGRPSTVL
jgi:actin-related protein 6